MAPKAQKPVPTYSRLALRVGLLLMVPSCAFLVGVRGRRLVYCICIAIVWCLLEASISFRLKLSRGCKKIPFVFRLLGSTVLEVQASWLLDAGGSIADVNDESTYSSVGPSSISVVLPCANETDFVLKTVQSVFEATPKELLKEIIVVDDASAPPISMLMQPSDLERYLARVIRHDVAEGLIRSKKQGGDLATGDVLIFLDCHVKPMDDWTVPIMQNLKENPKRVVVPTITSLDPETWQEVSGGAAGRKMCLTWNADFFWCNEYPGSEVPIMSGGLLAMTKFWWETIGGYDEQMHAWGGENLDQSLRTWLCGGEIRVAEGSRVAHMWRDASKPKTALHYQIPTEHVRRNRLRAVEAWFGPWAAKVRTFPEFQDFREGGPLSIGDIGNIEHYRDKLQCKDFNWYVNRFAAYYQATGQFPSSVFNLRNHKSGLCIHHEMKLGKSAAFRLRPCSYSSEMQRFHAANANPSGRCCSGMKLWNLDACLAGYATGQNVMPSTCQRFGATGVHYGGTHTAQEFELIQDGLLQWFGGKGCVVQKDDQPHPQPDHVVFEPCVESGAETEKRSAKEGQRFAKHDSRPDGSFLLRDEQSGECLGTKRHGDLTVLALSPCEQSKSERWTKPGGQLKYLALNLCIDANDMVTPILYPCYPPGSNVKQEYVMHENGWVEFPRAWADNGRLRYPALCLDSKPIDVVEIAIEDCDSARQAGQTWEKVWSETPLETEIYNSLSAKPQLRGNIQR